MKPRIPVLTDVERTALSEAGTAQRVAVFRAAGWQIIEGNEWQLPFRPRYRDCDVVRLRLTNSRRHGKCIATTFAVRRTK